MVLKELQRELDQLLNRYSSLRFDFQKRTEVLKGAVKGRLKMRTLMEFWEKDRELYMKLWNLLGFFKIVELSQEDSVELIVPKDVASFVKRAFKFVLEVD